MPKILKICSLKIHKGTEILKNPKPNETNWA